MSSYTFKCPICGYKQTIVSDYQNERVYCISCSGKGTAVLMDKISDNTHINVELLLEDDHK